MVVADLAIYGSLVLMVVILASILWTIERRERVPFVVGLALFIVAHTFLTGVELVGVAVAVAGIALAAASTVPMLRQSV